MTQENQNNFAGAVAGNSRRRIISRPADHHYWKWIASTPAVIAILATVAIAFVLGNSPTGTPSWYRTAADDAYDTHDYHTAVVCYERLMQTNPADPEIAFSLAESLQATGQNDSAESLLIRLAPLGQIGYPPAQLAMIRRLLSTDSPSDGALRAAEKRLTQLLQVSSSDSAKSLEIELLALRGKWSEADEYAQQIATLSTVVRNRMAEIAEQQKNDAETNRWAGNR